MNEYEVLDAMYEGIADAQIGVSLYEQHGDMVRPEMYVNINGECWRILAEPHLTHGTLT